MTCTAVQFPLFLTDLTQSQYLSPFPSTNLNELAADAHLRNEYKHQIEAKLAYSDAFRRQFLLFAEQFLYELKRPQEAYSLEHTQFTTPFEPLSTVASIANDDDEPHYLPSLSPPTAKSPQPPKRKTKSKAFKPRLQDPPLRLTSRLSPKPCGTILPGYEIRRPMPCRRHKEQPLLKQVLEKTVQPEYRTATKIASTTDNSGGGCYRRLDRAYEGLSSSWVVVPEDDWEFVMDGECTMLL